MPPKKPLTDEEIERLREWIARGAYLPDQPLHPFSITTNYRAGYDWWSLQPVAAKPPPEVSFEKGAPSWLRRWAEHPIDRFVYRRLQQVKLAPSPPASPRILIRRITYDLTGLPPTPDEIASFVDACEEETGQAKQVGEEAYQNLLDRLLASPRYGEHWARHWLDVARFGESTGFEVNHILDDLWPYRDYVIRSFNEDKPFDRFIREQIAGDSVDPGNPQVEIGMAFLVAGPHDIVGNQDPVQAAQIRANTVDEIIRTTSEAFLGITTGCARCHDHKFDPISQKDYYSLYATFGGVYHGTRTVATEAERERYKAAVAPLNEERSRLEQRLNELDEAILARAKERVTHYDSIWVRPPVSRQGTEEVFRPVEARFVRLIVEGRDTDPNAQTGFRLDEFEVWTAENQPRNVALGRNGGKATGNSNVPGDFSEAYRADLTIDGNYGARWIATGSELVIELAEPRRINRIVFSSDRLAQVSQTSGEAPIPCEYRIDVSRDGESWTQVADSYDRAPVNDGHRRHRYLAWETTAEERAEREVIQRALSSVRHRIAAVDRLPELRVGTLHESEEPFHVYIGGDPQRKGSEVVPSAIEGVARHGEDYSLPATAPERERRRARAEWIASPANPLTARVFVNRIWHYHFGTGLVSTPSDFGFMGSAPSHPELLGWLAQECLEPTYQGDSSDSWRWKRLHRMIVLSQTYRQSSQYREAPARVDGRSRLLWRFPPRRLSAEEIRDSMLVVAEKVDLKMGGPGFRLYRYLRDNVSTYVPLDKHGPETYRRAVYHQNVRASYIDLMTDYDYPDCARPAPRRASTTTPLQALTLMNHEFTMAMARALAGGVEQDATPQSARAAFKRVLGRTPTPFEEQTASSFIEEFGLVAFCRVMFNTNEFIYVD